jgi:hypothetical protein
MKENGVMACNLQFRVSITRSSILLMFLASNTSFASQTCGTSVHVSHFSKTYQGIIEQLLILQCCNFCFTWRSSGRGTTVSSILTARDRQATDINCCIQDLSCYNTNNQTKARNAMISSRSSYTVVSNVEVQILTGRLNVERNLSR